MYSAYAATAPPLSDEVEVIQSSRVDQISCGASYVAIAGFGEGAHHAVATVLLPQAQI